MRFFKAGFLLAVIAALAACTPEFAQQKSSELATQARLRDGITIQRTNQRLLSRQTQICLVSDSTGTDAGRELLRAMQIGFSGYFLAIGVENEPMDYLRAVANPPCPGPVYLFYVQPLGSSVCINEGQSCEPAFKYTVTVVSSGDGALVDRVQVAINKSFFPDGRDNAQRLQAAFAELASALTGAGNR